MLQNESSEEIVMTFFKNNNPINLSNLGIVIEFRLNKQDGDLVNRLTLASGLEIITVSEITKLKIKSFSLNTPGKIFYDVRMFFPNTDKLKFYAGGHLIVSPTVSQTNG